MKLQHWWLVLIAVVLVVSALDDSDALATCEKRMSTAVCMHSLYP
jgi:hypothetical protein